MLIRAFVESIWDRIRLGSCYLTGNQFPLLRLWSELGRPRVLEAAKKSPEIDRKLCLVEGLGGFPGRPGGECLTVPYPG